MISNCSVGEDSWESLGLQGDRILMEINPEYSLEELVLKLKLQYFGHLIWRAELTGKGPSAGKDWRQKKKGAAEDELVR